MMILMHLAWDIRYSFGVDVFGFLEARWFWAFVHPFFIVIFVGVSGVCCTFSRNNVTRGLKLLVVAVLLFCATFLITKYLKINCLIIFNVLALLSVGILLWALIEFVEKKCHVSPVVTNVLLAFLGSFAIVLGDEISRYDYKVDNLWLLPVGIKMESMPYQADYLPLFPWIGVFLIGCLAGRVCYAQRKTLFSNASGAVRKISAPFEFFGKHSLIIYLIHQPIVFGILYLIFMLIRGRES